ncbi:hypothetical protein B484DRAFT_403214 [Ochromonadaceae sp. CCMP2298]|nr:hypothetical protein B484DRAFT_403214 [Ochromonadaceae sp. CCMP2298]
MLVNLAKVRVDSPPDLAVLAFVTTAPRKVHMYGAEYVAFGVSDLMRSPATARVLVSARAFAAIRTQAAQGVEHAGVGAYSGGGSGVGAGGGGKLEGLLLLLLRPLASLGEDGSLLLRVELQRHIAVLGRCRHYALCGALKRCGHGQGQLQQGQEQQGQSNRSELGLQT